MEFTTLIEKTSQLLQIEDLKLKENNTVSLSFDDVIVNFETDGKYVFLATKLANIPTNKQQLIYDFLLTASNFGRFNAYVGLNNNLGILTFVTKELLETIDENFFVNCLESHIQNIEFLRESMQYLQDMPEAKQEEISDTMNMIKA